MKKFMLLLSLLLALPVFGAVSTDQKYQLNNQMGGVAHQVQLGTLIEQAEMVNGDSTTTEATQGTSGHKLKRLARIDYTPATMGGDDLASSTSLGVAIPGKSIITRGFAQVKTQFVDGGSGKVGLECGAGTANILAPLDFTAFGAGSVVELIPTGTAATMIIVPTNCNVSATVTVASQTAGEAVIFLEYVTGE